MTKLNGTGSNLNKILFILNPSEFRLWQNDLLQRLRQAGHQIGISCTVQAQPLTRSLDAVLAIEKRRLGLSLAHPASPPSPVEIAEPSLVVDLANSAPQVSGAPVLQLRFNGQPSFAQGLSQMLAGDGLPEITALLDGKQVGIARPMLSDRLWLSRASNEILSGAAALVEQVVARFAAGALVSMEAAAVKSPASGFWRHYLPNLATALTQRVRHKLSTGRPFYWQVGFRRCDSEGADIATSTAVDGEPFSILGDDGERFYADPFVIEHQGRTLLFVEEYPYASGKGIISVAELNDDGQFGLPRPVLEEPYHLSYPQVFAHEGQFFMLPESGGAKRLVLYRAASFPDRWEVDTVLIEGRDINDATVLERDGRFWLFATERSGHGSASDTMVVFWAHGLRGPWTPHKLNPIVIDRSAARPGGAFFEHDGRTFLPVQDGKNSYGGGLGLMELLRLDEDDVIFAPPTPIKPGPAWAVTGIHTLNRSGCIEVIDSAG